MRGVALDYSSSSILKADHPLLAQALAKRADSERDTQSQSYFDHVHQAYLSWRTLVVVHDGLIERVAETTGVSKQAILQSSLLCVALHDVGKLSENFQRMMRAQNEAEYRRAMSMNFRHEVIPLCLVRAFAAQLALNAEKPIPGSGVLETLAVAGHHRYLADGYLIDEEKFSNEIEWRAPFSLMRSLPAAVNLCSAMFQEQGWTAPSIIDKTTLKEISATLESREKAWQYLKQRFLGLCTIRESTGFSELRPLFALIKGLLMTADWMASGTNSHDNFLDAFADTVRIPQNHLISYVRGRVRSRGFKFTGFRPFQNECGRELTHVLAVAPTGSGKTEAAMLWGLRQIESGAVKKLLFLMPTMVTANGLHRRMNEFFYEQHGHYVSLVHSTADLIRSQSTSVHLDDTDGASRIDAHSLRDPHLFAPVTVGTIDQMLVTAMHSGRWAMKTLAAANSAIVIDELHAYDPHTAGLVMLLLKQLSSMGTRFLVMSATLPSDLRRAVSTALAPQQVVTIEDHSLLTKSRNCWTAIETPLSAWLGMAEDSKASISLGFKQLSKQTNPAGEKIRILIVVNTVKRCQDIAKHLSEFHPICYHSKFTFNDRRKKESIIEDQKPRLLIATQVVEVSLDIDYDILLTECAPVDALIQRAGRVNRPRREEPGQVFVFQQEIGSDKIYGEPIGILESTWREVGSHSGQCFTEQQLLDMVETVYAGKDISSNDDFKYIQNVVLGMQEQLSGVLDSPKPYEADAIMKTRLENYAQHSAIPQKFADECEGASYLTRRAFELKVPLWYFLRFKDRDAPEDFPLCQMDYDEHYGAQLLPTDSIPNPGHFIF